MYYDNFKQALDSGAFCCLIGTVEMHENSTTYQVADCEDHIFPVEIAHTYIASTFVLILN